MKKFNEHVNLLLVLLAAILFSCDLLETQEPPTGTGNVVIRITDAPFPVKEVTNVFLSIDKAEMHITGDHIIRSGDQQAGKKDKKDKKEKNHTHIDFKRDSGFVTVFETETPKKIDLLKLQNGVTEILAEAVVPAGKYDLIRLHIVDAEVVTNDAAFPLKVPPGNSSSLKIKLDTVLVVEEGEGISEILLDIDLSSSFTAIGHGNGKKGFKGFIFKPVIRACNHHYSGSISGMVHENKSTPVEGALITVFHGGEIVTTAVTDNLGKYKVLGLMHGAYAMTVEKEGYNKVSINRISVWKKSDVKKNIQLVK